MGAKAAQPQGRPVGSRTRVSAEEFVRIWQKSADINEVMRKTGNSRNNVTERACRYRKRGVPLKRMPGPGGPRCDYDALAALANSLNDQH